MKKWFKSKLNPLACKGIMVLLAFFIFLSNIFAQKQTITGIVTDATSNSALPGVNVIEKGTTNGTVTGVDGAYTIEVAGPSSILEFSYVGYLSESMKVGDNTSFSISLVEDVTQLEQVVVIGYGVQKKSDLTGAVTSVSAKDLKSIPVTRIDEALEGRAAGVNVVAGTGMPGGSRNIQIRGVSSINGFNPLIVVDGIPTGDVNVLNRISPGDIESMEILKDAASAAIYGSTGGNGVILITTKKGQAGKITTSLNMYTGIQEIPKYIPMMDTRQWNQFYASRNTTNGNAPYIFSEDSLNLNTDWQDAIFNSAPLYDVQLNITGGNEKSQFSVGIDYLKQEGMIENTSYDKLLLSASSTHQLTKRIKFDEVIRFANEKTTGPAEWQYQNVYNNYTTLPALTELPFLTPYDEEGNWTVNSVVTQSQNPFVGIDMRSDQYIKNMNLIINLGLNIELIKGLIYTTRLNGEAGIYEDWNFQPIYYATDVDNNPRSKLTQNWTRGFSWTFQNYLTYSRTLFNDHSFSLMAGMEAAKWWDYHIGGYRWDLPSTDPNLIYFDNSTDLSTTGQIIGGSAKEARSQAYFGRINYNYRSLVLAQFNIRRDGESNFGPNYKYGNFYSGSLGFKFSELQVIKDLNIFSFGKVRVGVGQTGQFPIASYWPYASTVLNTAVMNYSFDNANLSLGQGPVQVPNPDLRWETVTTTNIGADLGFLRDQLNVTIDYFIKNNEGMIMQQAVNSIAGTWLLANPANAAEVGNTGITTTYPSVNYGSVNNKGIEFTVDYRKQLGDLRVNFGVNFTYQTNKITELATDSTVQGSVHDLNGITVSKVGHSIGEFHGYVFDGVFKEGDPVVYNAKSKKYVYANQPYLIDDKGDTSYAKPNAKAGDARWVDVNQDGKLNTNDWDYLGSYIPPYVYGFSLGLEYKGIDFSAFFQGVYGNKIFNGLKRFLYTWENYGNHRADFADRYHAPVVYNGVTIDPGNLTSDLPDVGAQNWGVVSSLYIEDGSYLRLRTLTLGYTLPRKWTNVVAIERFRIYFIGKNLFTFTNYTGYDPEISTSDPKVAGIDVAGYPQSRMYTFGINVDF